MAQELFPEFHGGIAVEANRKDEATGLPKPYTITDIPVGEEITYVSVGVPQWQYPLDENGNAFTVDGVAKKEATTERGLRVLVNKPSQTYPNPNVPIFFKVGDPIKFNADYEYTFFDSGTISFGIKVAP